MHVRIVALGLVHIRARQLDEAPKQRQRPLLRVLVGRVELVDDRLDLTCVKAVALVHLDEPEALAALHDDVEPAVVEPLEHLCHSCPRADSPQSVLVCEHEPELALLLETLGDQLAVPRLEDV